MLSYYLAPTKYSFPQAVSVIALCSKASCGLLHPNNPPPTLTSLSLEDLNGYFAYVMMLVYFSFNQGHCCDTQPPQSINISHIDLTGLLSGLTCLRGRFDETEWEVTVFTDYFLGSACFLLLGGLRDKDKDKFGPLSYQLCLITK